jgi:hypothetical protein
MVNKAAVFVNAGSFKNIMKSRRLVFMFRLKGHTVNGTAYYCSAVEGVL